MPSEESKSQMNRLTKWPKWAIDKEKVESSGDTWEEVYRSQRRVPGFVLAIVIIWSYWLYQSGRLNWMVVAGGLVIVAYSFIPTIGAYQYMTECECHE